MKKTMKKNVIVILCTAFLVTCKDMGTGTQYPTQGISEDHSDIADPYARWQAYHLTSYVIDEQHSCFCAYGGEVCRVCVRDNKVIDVIKKSDGTSIFAQMPQTFKTVDELFALASSINPDSVASVVIQYDARFGFPKLISVNPRLQIADEEYAYYTQNIERLVY